MPFAVTLVEFELHEVAGDGSEEHVAWLTTNGVVELEDLVVAGTTLPNTQALVPRQYSGDGFGHRRLLRHIQNVDGARAHRFDSIRLGTGWVQMIIGFEAYGFMNVGEMGL